MIGAAGTKHEHAKKQFKIIFSVQGATQNIQPLFENSRSSYI